MMRQDVYGVDSSKKKQVPRFVIRHSDKFVNAETVLDIGAGHGRFLEWFLKYTNVRKYIAVEPWQPFVSRLRKIVSKYSNRKAEVVIINKPWQDVRDVLLREVYDVIVAWDVFMFMDLRDIWKLEDYQACVANEICELVKHCRWLLLSFQRSKYGLPGLRDFEDFKTIVSLANKLCRLDIVDKFSCLNYLIRGKA